MITLRNPTSRNTQAHVVTIGEWELFFSYETLIAARGPNFEYRIANSWGPTTGRHFRELGCYNFPIHNTSDGAFEERVQNAMNEGCIG